MNNQISEIVSKIYGKSVGIVDSLSQSGGCINDTHIISLSNGEKIFLKHNSVPPKKFFKKEAIGLNLLRSIKGGPRVPKVLFDEHENFLLLEYIPHESPRGNFYESFARSLAILHRTTNSYFGFDHDNFIGKTIQRNNKEVDPIVFFLEHRIRFQQDLARERGLLSSGVNMSLDRLCERLEKFLDVTGEKPALTHGDLWAGNHFCGPGQEAYIVDPATSFGLRETDLAMTELFGRMPKRFYEAYHEAFPMNPGYEDRRDIYNIYHLLNHLNLFGQSYLSSVEKILDRFIR